MKICFNGIIRDMTPEEELKYQKLEEAMNNSLADDLYNIIDILTGEEDADKNN